MNPRTKDRLRRCLAPAGLLLALGVMIMVRAPWEQPLPPGVELGDCDTAGSWVVSVTATWAGAAGAEPLPRVELRRPFSEAPDVGPAGPRLDAVLSACDGLGVLVDLAPGPEGGLVPSSVDVRDQRLRIDGGSLYLNSPYSLPCPENASCGGWEGWFFTLGSPDSGVASFTSPVSWRVPGATPEDHSGVLDVEVRVQPA